MKKVCFILCVFFLLNSLRVSAQTTIANYDFNSSTSSPVSTAGGVTSSGSSDQTISYNAGVASGGAAFTANATAGQDMSITSGNVATHYFQFQLGGASLNTYCSYKLYFQIKSSATGATAVAVKYSTNGGVSYTTYTTVTVNTSFVEQVIDLSSVTALNSQSSIYFQLNTSGGSGAGGTTAIDNFEVQATTSCAACSSPTKASGVGVSGVSTTLLTTSWTGGNGYGGVVVVSTSNVAPTPTGGTIYNANTVYGSGDPMGTAFTVYNGTGTTVNVTGLTCNTTYYVYVFEYNNTGTSSPCYTTSATTNTTTSACAAASINMSNTNYTITSCPSTIHFYDSGGSGGSCSTSGAGSNYADNETFTKTITAPAGQCLSVSFNSFCTENTYDYLYVYDGTSTGSTLLGSYTGSTIPPTVVSSTGSLTFKFTSDFSNNYTGWDATITCSTCPSSAIIMGNTNYTISACPFSAHFYDSGNSSGSYANNESFTKTITAPAGNCLSVVFNSFSTESNYDYLYIYDGTSTAATLIGKYSGASNPPTVTSSSGSLTFKFTSDVSNTSTGWDALVSCTSCGGTSTISTPTLTPDPITLAGCGGVATATVNVTTTGVFTSNTFTVYLIDPSIGITSGISIGTFTATSGTHTVTIPAGMIADSLYQVYVQSNSPAVTSNNSNQFTINTTCNQSISLNTPTPSPIALGNCATSHTATVTFTSVGITYNSGNIDSLFMSDASGNFTNEVYVGSIATTTASSTITFTVPAGTYAGTNYQLQLISSNPYQQSNASPAFTITGCTAPTITTNSLNATSYALACASSQTGTITITTTGTYNAGNVFTVQLSDVTGSFSNPVSIGTKTATTTGTFTIPFTIPAGTTAGTSYQINVVSSNSVITGSSSASFTITNSCVLTNCPSVTGVITDGCDSGADPCAEGQSEVIFVNTGTYSVSVSAFNTPKVINYYGSTTNYNAGKPDSYTGNMVPASAAMVSTLNTSTTTCSGVFTVPSGTLAPGSVIMMVACDFCNTNYDFSNICAGFTKIYVMTYGTPRCGTGGQWNVSGNFGNHNGGTGTNPKYIMADFSGVTAPSSTCGAEYYTYYAGTETNGNGASVAYSGISTSLASPTNPSTYTGSGCKLPVVLPIQLLRFTAAKTNQNIMLNWATITQVNNNYFEAEYSLDGKDFIPFYQVKGAGNSHDILEYTCPFNINIGDNTPYFRLKQVDFNGSFNYSNIITLDNNKYAERSLTAYYNTDKDKIIGNFHLEYPQQVNISLYNVSGEEVSVINAFYDEGDNQILLNIPLTAGIYFLVYQNATGVPVHKKIIVSK